MMDVPLTTWLLFSPAGRHHHQTEVVSRSSHGEVHRYTFGDFYRRAQQLMHGLDALGIQPGQRVATLSYNGYRHLEAYFGVPCSGRVLHTLNLRLSAAELAFIMNDADDAAVLVESEFLPLLDSVLPQVPGLRHVIVLDGPAPSREGSAAAWVAYEDLIGSQSGEFARPALDERDPAGLCYTSGTTGKPKGVLYTHRSTFLHALAVTSAAGMSVGPGDCVLPQVPMFHAGAWGLPHAAVAVGAKLVFYAGAFDAPAFADLLLGERVTIAAGVPTVWIGLADELVRRQVRLSDIRHIISGGSQPPRSLIERYAQEFGARIVQAWGMTETSPLASMAWPHEQMRSWSEDEVTTAARTQAGLPVPGLEVSIRDEQGKEVAFDGITMGGLHVRGPWVTDQYVHGIGAEQFTEDGWFDTGDIAIGSPNGYFVIADRTKDLIKSGGEWISSVDMEAAIMGLPGVVEAAVIAIPDPKYIERPLACIVAGPEGAPSLESIRASLEARGFARWQLPDRVELMDDVPKTAVGKFDKKVLRARFAASS
jgi:fatty-acyl-CoA synthase